MREFQSMPVRQAALALAALSLLAGCAVGPDFAAPAAPAVDRYSTRPLPAQTEAVAVPGGEAQHFVLGQALPGQWWTLFGSEKLNQLVQQALANSPNVASAQAALLRAQHLLSAERGGLLPSVDASAQVQRQKTSGAAFGMPGMGNVFDLYNASVRVSYTLDLFGGVRRAIEAQQAAVDVQQYELQGTYLTLAGNVVTSAVQEASLRAQLAATREILAVLDKQLKITERQFELGGVARAEVLQARANLASTRATLPALEQQLSVVQNQLAVYLGRLPAEHEVTDFELATLTLPQQIPLSLPSELVRRRPDVKAAEALMAQASAQVGVATANQFPQISLSANLATETSRAADLFSSGIWSLGAGLTQPVFRGGGLAAQKHAAEATYEQTAAAYRQTVLVAFQNVADALRALETGAQALAAQHEASTAAQASLKLAEQQFALGGIGFPVLLNAQRQVQQTRIAYLQALAARYQDTAALFQSLGGGWDAGQAVAVNQKVAR